jgi:hypothetical protein
MDIILETKKGHPKGAETHSKAVETHPGFEAHS